MWAHNAGNLAEAETLCNFVLAHDRRQFDALNLLGIIHAQRRNHDEAVRIIERALKVNPRSAEAYANLGRVQFAMGDAARAAASYVKALAIKPDFVLALVNYSIVLRHCGRPLDALAQCDRALALQPNAADASNNRGNALFDLRRYREALAAHDHALALAPQLAEAWLGRGNDCVELRRHDDALAAYGRVLAQNPNSEKAWLGAGNALSGRVRLDEAAAAYDRALAIDPNLADARLGRGAALTRLGRYSDALTEYDRAFRQKPDHAWLGRANVLTALRRFDEARAAIEQAIALNPGLADAWHARGWAAELLRQFDEAAASYGRALGLDPRLKYILGQYLHAKQHLCDWTDLDLLCSDIRSGVERGEPVAIPFVLLGIPSSPRDQLKAAQIYIADQFPPSPRPFWQDERYDHDRIKIAYLSADFREHAVSYLLAGLFAGHDRSRFETIAFSFGPNLASAMRERISGSFEHFIDVDGRTDVDVAKMMRDMEVDIAVNLGGFTLFNRIGILAHRPAPIQVGYLGFAGTMGADYIDYIIADRCVIPPDRASDYAEKPVYLPDSFMASDDTCRIAGPATNRTEAGLPEGCFVFCCFNQAFKIMPDVFAIWMRLLGNVEGSVLWLQAADPQTARNLRREAEARGIAGDRLVFAQKVEKHEDHLARHRLADLFLDTLPYNAHTAASEALWTGLPVLTRTGSTFAGRVAASLLHAVGLPELVTTTAADYEALALRLATDAALLASVKAKLAANLPTQPLFRTDRFRRHIEAAYATMHERHRRGEPPASFAVPAIANA